MVVCRITSIIKRKRGQRLRKELRHALGGREELQADWEHTAVVLREAAKLFGASSGQRKYWKVRLMAKREKRGKKNQSINWPGRERLRWKRCAVG